jgi:hypothetical protein
VTDIDRVLIAVEQALASDEFKARLLGILKRKGYVRLTRNEICYYRVKAAEGLLAGGMPCNEATKVLVERFGVHLSTAYDWFAKAKQMRQGRLFD